MKNVVKMLFVAVTMLLAVTLFPASSVEAKTKAKKLTVNTVYNTSKKITGKTKKGYKVKVTLDKKIYKAKAKKNGKYKIKIPKQKKLIGRKIVVKVYKKKGKLYAKKKTYVTVRGLKLVNFYDKETEVKGFYNGAYRVEAEINGKTYQSDFQDNEPGGYFEVHVNKWLGSKKIKIHIYNKKGKLLKTYTRKPKKLKKISRTQEIPLKKFLKDIKEAQTTGREFFYDIQFGKTADTKYNYHYYPKKGTFSIGYVNYYMEFYWENGSMCYPYFKAKHGITLYINMCTEISNEDVDKQVPSENLEIPSDKKYQYKVTPGETFCFNSTTFGENADWGELGALGFYYKVTGYKNGKLVMLQYFSRAISDYKYHDWR